jgi:preprotein translocase subunit SecF
MHLNIVKNRNKYFIFSGILILISIVSLAIWGLKPSIDFSGGALLEVEVKAEQKLAAPELSDKITNAWKDLGEVKVQPLGESSFIIRTKHLSEDEHQNLLAQVASAHGLTKAELEEKRFETIGPVIGQELKTKAIWAIVIASLAIIFYIAYSFRKISKPVASWKYGLGAVLALIHDILIVTGCFSIFGYFLGFEVDLLFISALLTILGFSVHDTIVVYDRTRENLIYNPQKTFEETVDKAINDTMRRSINTSLTVFIVLLSLFLIGGESTKNFVLALMIGVVIGTYSSIFVASTLLVVWYKLGLKIKK